MESSTQDAPAPSALQILVVDDNADAAATLSLALELSGHRTATAANGREAVDAAAKEPYDAVLLDLHMPVMDGLAAARLIGRMRPEAKLIACSAWCDEEARRRTAEAGFCGHLAKPASLEVIATTLERLCGDHSALATH